MHLRYIGFIQFRLNPISDNMVSIVLLTTEEVLQSNGYWYCLDTMWITEDLDPFEEVKPEHMFSKPLARDIYYAKYPDIPRSESEDENSFSVHGFRRKHKAWKSKIRIRKVSRRYSLESTYCLNSGSYSIVDISSRTTSLTKNDKTSSIKSSEDDEKVRAFFNRLIESVPPPPVNDITNDESILISPKTYNELSDLDLPDYADFANKNISHSKEQMQGPQTSTMKKSKRIVDLSTSSLKSDSDRCDSWYESIYGVSAIMDGPSDGMHMINNDSGSISWSDVINVCGLSDSVLRSRESLNSEKIISQSHAGNTVSNMSRENEDLAYERFAVHKLGKSLRVSVPDSSSLHNFGDSDSFSQAFFAQDRVVFGTLYRLAPSTDSVNEA